MTVEERISLLESELSRAKGRTRWFGVACLCGIGVAIAGATQQPDNHPKPVRAAGFILEDEHGARRGELGASKDGAFFKLYDATGKERVSIGVEADGPRFDLLDDQEKHCVRIAAMRSTNSVSLFHDDKERSFWNVDRHGDTALLMSDRQDVGRTVLNVDGDGPCLAMRDSAGEARVKLRVGPLLRFGSFPSLSMAGEDGKDRIQLYANDDYANLLFLAKQFRQSISLGVEKDQKGLSLWDEAGHVRTRLQLDGLGAHLEMSDKQGVERARFGASDVSGPDGAHTMNPESSILLFGPTGNTIWKPR